MKKQAKQILMENVTESNVVAACMDYLLQKGHYVWRNNTGVTKAEYEMKDGTVKKRFWRAGVVGSSDILGIAKDGKMIAVECKKPGKKTTEAQDEFLQKIDKRGGYAIIAFGIDELQEVGL